MKELISSETTGGSIMWNNHESIGIATNVWCFKEAQAYAKGHFGEKDA
jgi:hypothetical protein